MSSLSCLLKKRALTCSLKLNVNGYTLFTIAFSEEMTRWFDLYLRVISSFWVICSEFLGILEERVLSDELDDLVLDFAHLLLANLELSLVKLIWVRWFNAYVGRLAIVFLVLFIFLRIFADLLAEDELSVLVEQVYLFVRNHFFDSLVNFCSRSHRFFDVFRELLTNLFTNFFSKLHFDTC